MKVQVEKQPKSTLKITVTVPADKVKETYEEVLKEEAGKAEIKGFRKGKAPANVVEEEMGNSKLYGIVVNKLLQKYYTQAIKENHISPIANPRVEVKEFDLEKEFEFTATTATRPDVKVGAYVPKLKKRFEQKMKQAKKDLEQTNKERLEKGEPLEEPHVHIGTNDILEILNEVATVEIPDLLIEEETDRMMSKIIEQTEQLGMTIEQYLKAQDKQADELRAEYSQVAENNIRSEFILGHLVQREKVTVSDEEIRAAFTAAGIEDIDKKMQNPMEKVYVQSILQKNQLLTKIMEEVEGEHHHDH
jgi:FKBP-type peptidyl-prolyl cis-trans isomerase (trigger factor)